MNILVVCNYELYQDINYSFVHNQIREYAAMGHCVRVVIPAPMGKKARNGKRIDKPFLVWQADSVELCDIRYFSLGKFGRKHFNYASALATIRLLSNRILKGFHPDVIHAHTIGMVSEMGAILTKRVGCPLVVTTHGGDTVLPLTQGRHQWLKECCDQADAIVAVSSQLGNRVISCNTNTPVCIIHNGFVVREIPDGTERKTGSMIQVCNLFHTKKVNMTIRAFAMLRERYPEITLKIVGQGHLRKELEELCEQLGISTAVRFTGQLPNEKVFQQLCETEYFVMASKPEGFGIVYLEAMAAGCIVIGTEDQGIADVIKNGQNGFLVPADDPGAIAKVIFECIEHPQRSREIALCGQQTAQDFTWMRTAKQYIALFQKLIEEYV